MSIHLAPLAACLAALSTPLLAQDLIAVEWDGDVFRIDAATGNGVMIGQTGYTNARQQGHNSMAIDQSGTIWVTFARPGTTELFRINPNNGAATPNMVQMQVDVRGLAVAPDGTMFAVADATPDELYTIDPINNVATLVGATNHSVLQSLAWVNGSLYSWDLSVGLVSIDPITGASADVSTSNGSGSRPQFLTPDGQGNLIGGRASLYAIDVTTGAETLIGSNSTYTDVRGADVLGGGVAYGQGCPGTGGRTPLIDDRGFALSPGNFSLVVAQGLPNAAFAWAFGTGRNTIPLPGNCLLLVNPPLVTAGSMLDANGGSVLPITVATGFRGVVLNVQAVLVDPNAPSGGSLSTTGGLEITIQ